MRVGRCAIQTGTSAPKSAKLSSEGTSTSHISDNSRMQAAASVEPPPIPDATGRFLRSRSAAPLSASVRAARITKLSAPASKPSPNGPLISNVSSLLGDASSTSPKCGKTTMESSRCIPSSLRPVTCRQRLTLARASSTGISLRLPLPVPRPDQLPTCA